MHATRWPRILVASLCIVGAGLGAAAADETKQQVQINVDDERGAALPCRIHWTDGTGKAASAAGLPFWKDHFCCSGRATLQLPPGHYRYEIERGPEHQRLRGTLEVKAGRDHTLHLQLGRIAELHKQGWYSGDLHVHRPVADIELLMKAEDLYVAPVITWWNTTNPWANRERPRELLRRFDGNRFTHIMAGEDERGGGALLYFHLTEPLPITKAAREHPPAVTFAEQARQRDKNVWIDIEKPFWWDVPAWLASGQADSIELANNHMCRSQMYANEAWGRPRDERQLPGPLGNGRWTQEIYYHLLNCGLRLPPSAGSASGVLPNPVGYNRVYIHVGGDFTYEKWWAGLKAGRSFVTNGPLLLCRANGKLPGHVFREAKGLPVGVGLDITLIGLDRVPRLEIIRDGKVAATLDLDDVTSRQRTARLTFQESGWFLVRAVADNKQTYRFASTAPFYVEIGDRKHRISKSSAQFFRDWVSDRIDRLRETKMSAEERREVIAEQEKARQYWQGVVERANVE